MKKMVFGKKFSRDTTSRRALYRALVRAFVINRSITTTSTKARVAVPILERLFVSAKKDRLSDRRFVMSYMGNDRVVTDKLFEYTAKMTHIQGGFLKIINLPSRKGDNASMARVEFVKKPEEVSIKEEDTAKVVSKADAKTNKSEKPQKKVAEKPAKKKKVAKK